MTAVIPAGVETARDLVGPALAAAVERLSPDVRKVAAYHLGLAGPEGAPPGAVDGARPGGGTRGGRGARGRPPRTPAAGFRTRRERPIILPCRRRSAQVL